jgi:hypothetical protein
MKDFFVELAQATIAAAIIGFPFFLYFFNWSK